MENQTKIKWKFENPMKMIKHGVNIGEHSVRIKQSTENEWKFKENQYKSKKPTMITQYKSDKIVAKTWI